MVNPTVVFLINIEMVGVTGQWMIAKDIQNKNADAKFSVHDAFLNKKNALMTFEWESDNISYSDVQLDFTTPTRYWYMHS